MDGISPTQYTVITRSGAEVVDAPVITESVVCIYVNGQELVTMMASPHDLRALALGFLANEGIIASLDEVEQIDVRDNGRCVDVWLTKAFEKPEKRTLTSGCGQGVTFDDGSTEHAPVTSDKHITPEQLWSAMQQLHEASTLYREARGIHTSGLSDGQRLLLIAEDIGRHNTLDKLRGHVMTGSIRTDDLILLATGRISSEMISKARHMNISVVCSRTSPTSRSVHLAEAWRITLVGYLRRNSMNVYTHPDRIKEQPL